MLRAVVGDVAFAVRVVVPDASQMAEQLARGDGPFFLGKAGQYFCTSASRSSLPRSDSWRIAVAVMGLEIEPNRKSVKGVAGTKFSRSAIPKPEDQTSSPSWTTATEIPGTLFTAMKLEAAFSICARLLAERLLFCAWSGTEPREKTNRRAASRHPAHAVFGRRIIGVGLT